MSLDGASYESQSVVWLNGTFGVGKTSVDGIADSVPA